MSNFDETSAPVVVEKTSGAAFGKIRSDSRFSFALVLAITSLIAGLALVFTLPTRAEETVELVSKPEFPFEVVWEEGLDDGSLMHAIIVIAPEQYSRSNVRHVFLWYRQNHPMATDIYIKLFTNRDQATVRNSVLPMGSFRRLIKLYPWDADYARSEGPPGKVDHVYGYKPISWFPFWRKDITLHDR